MYDELNYRNLIAGVNTTIPLMNGESVTAINFDNAATTPPFISVMNSINNFAPWYSSIHRGTGYKSRFCSDFYEKSRETVASFINADLDNDAIIYVKNTTEAINKVSYRLYDKGKGSVILSTGMEHHSNDLPWRKKYRLDYVSVNSNGELSLNDLERKLKKYKGEVKLLAVTGASNVTGIKNNIRLIAAIAHKYRTKILVDAAQLVPHSRADMMPHNSEEHIDFLVFSAHKMYAPFGTGVLVAPKAIFESGSPEYSGGGTIDVVTHDFVKWASPPAREEAGTPNLMGVAALTEAIKTLEAIGMDKVEKYEKSLTEYALHKLNDVPDIILYGNEGSCDNKVSIIPFNINGLPHQIVAAALSYEFGVAVRNGCFCAQPYVQKLLDISKKDMRKYARDPSLIRPGMVRISFGIYNIYDEVDTLVKALITIANNKKEYYNKYNFAMNEH